jgi:hypothetical protein
VYEGKSSKSEVVVYEGMPSKSDVDVYEGKSEVIVYEGKSEVVVYEGKSSKLEVVVYEGKSSKSDADVCVAIAFESVGVGEAGGLSTWCHLRLLVVFFPNRRRLELFVMVKELNEG